MNVSIPPGIMFTLTHPDAVETSSKGRPTDRAERYRGLGWWTSQRTQGTVTPESEEREECCSTQSARLATVRA
ncbi:MAG: hypothetical protein GWN58_61845 [Anaerolineae bacterium]|nr:hypothetical protein [Anaerolineae bacterium]